MKKSVEQRVMNAVIKVMNGKGDQMVVISVETQTVVKLHRETPDPENGNDDPNIEVFFLEEDAYWERCMEITWPKDRNYRFLVHMIMSVDFD